MAIFTDLAGMLFWMHPNLLVIYAIIVGDIINFNSN